MSLDTGKKIIRRNWTELPMTETVIRQIEKWATKDRAVTGLKFMNKYGVEYTDEEEDDDGILIPEEEAAAYPDIPAEMPGMATEYNKIHHKPIQGWY